MGMSVISFNKFASLISETSSSGGLCGQIRSILVLQYRLDHLEEQDLYFQMGRKNHGERLAEMKKQYDAAINYGNSKTVVELFAETENAKDTINFLHTQVFSRYAESRREACRGLTGFILRVPPDNFMTRTVIRVGGVFTGKGLRVWFSGL